MTLEESNLITRLFDHLLQSAASQQRDPEAERLILTKVAENPHAPYQLAQSTLVLQQAVTSAQERIAALEKQAAEASAQPSGSGSFLSGFSNLFGTPQPVSQPASVRPVQMPPIPVQQPSAPSQGGGFLQTALSTAAGVAGGALLFQGIENLLGHNAGPFGGTGGLGGMGGVGQGQPLDVTNNYFENAPADSTASDLSDQNFAPINPGVDLTALNPETSAPTQDDFTFNNPGDSSDLGQGDDSNFFGGDDSSLL